MGITIPRVGAVKRPQSQGYDGHIDDILIRLAVSPGHKLEDMTAEGTPPRVDTTESAEDVRDETGRRYSRSNLSGGAGLDFLHSPNRSADASLRYWDSKGIDPFAVKKGEIYGAELLHRVDLENAQTGILKAVTAGGLVFYLVGTTLYEYDDLSRATLSATGLDMASMGNSVFTLDATDGIERFDLPSGATWASTNVDPTILYTKMWAVKERILAWKPSTNELFEAHATTPVSLLTLADGVEIVDVVDTAEVVLVFTTSGTIHVLGLDPTDGVTLTQIGQTKFIDEIPLMAAESFGTLGIVTAEPTEDGGNVARFYTAEYSNGSVGNLQLIFQIGDRETSDDLTPQAICVTRDSFYVAIPEEGVTTEVTLWRYYLPTGGYARAHSVDPGAAYAVSSVFDTDDRFWMAVLSSGLWRETDEYVSEGYSIGPVADFFTADDKQWVGAELSGRPLPTGTALELYDTDDTGLMTNPGSATWRLVLSFLAGQDAAVNTTLSARSSRYHIAKVKWLSDAAHLLTPTFRSYSFRALPNPTRDILVRIPINVSDQIESRGRRAITVPGRGKVMEAALRLLEGKHVIIELYKDEFQVRGLIEKFESTVQVLTSLGSTKDVMYALIRGTKIADSQGFGLTTSGASLGQETLGIIALGEGVVNT